MIVGYQGEPGAFSDEAARALGARETRGYPTFAALCAAVAEGAIPFGLLPMRNTLAGRIDGAQAALARYPRLRVLRALDYRVEQALIGIPGAALADVRCVRSHPAALAQCAAFLARLRGVAVRPHADTAGAVREVVAAGDPRTAAIGPAGAAARYGGIVLARAIQDVRENHTRFRLIASPDCAPERLAAARLESPFPVDTERLIRAIPDFPIPGILFRDITPMLKDKDGFKEAVDLFVDRFKGQGIDYVVGIEARGYMLGAPLAYAIGAGFIPVRKPGKLPYSKLSESYALEYGTNSLEIHADALDHGDRVVVVDDLLATGGTAAATRRLLERLGGKIEAFAFLIELEALKGRDVLGGVDVVSFIRY